MSEVGDAIEVTYTTAPNATVTLTWINRDTDMIELDQVPVTERLDDDGNATGQFPISVQGTSVGMWEARFVSSGTADSVESYFERFEIVNQLPPFASVGEYEELYGALSAGRQATCRALLRRASKLIRDSFPAVDARVSHGTASRDTIGLVVINMAAQVMRNPAGLRSETTGPFSRAYDVDAASGMLQLTENDRSLLAEAGLNSSVSKRGVIGSARITGGMVPPVRRPGRRWPRGGAFPSGW